MGSNPKSSQPSEQPLGQSAGGKGNCIETLEWVFETGVDGQIGWDLTGVD
jgi:hypothetical protein